MKIIKDLYGRMDTFGNTLIINSKIQMENELDYSTKFIYKIQTSYQNDKTSYIFEILYGPPELGKFTIPPSNSNVGQYYPTIKVYSKQNDELIFEQTLNFNETFYSIMLNIINLNDIGEIYQFISFYNREQVINFGDIVSMNIVDFVNSSKFILSTQDSSEISYKPNIKKDKNNNFYLTTDVIQDIKNYHNIPNSINKMIIKSEEPLSNENFNFIINNDFNYTNYLISEISENNDIIFSTYGEGQTLINLFKLIVISNKSDESDESSLFQTELILTPLPLVKGLESHYYFYLNTLTQNLLQLCYNKRGDNSYIPLSGFTISINNPKIYTMNDSPFIMNEYPKLIQESKDYFIKVKLSYLAEDNIKLKFSQSFISIHESDYINFDDNNIFIEDTKSIYEDSGIASESVYYTGTIIKFRIDKTKLKKSSKYDFDFNVVPILTDDFESSMGWFNSRIFSFETDIEGNIIMINPFNDDSNNFYFTANQTVEFDLNKELISEIKSAELVFSAKEQNYIDTPHTNYLVIDLNNTETQEFLNYQISVDKINNKIIVKHDIKDSICYITFGSFFLELTLNNNIKYKSKTYTNIPVEFISLESKDGTLSELVSITSFDDSETKIKLLESKTKEFIYPNNEEIYINILRKEENTILKHPVLWFKNNKLLSSEIINIDNLDFVTPLKYDTLNTNENLLNYVDDKLLNNHKLYILSLNKEDSGVYTNRVKYYLGNLAIYLQDSEVSLQVNGDDLNEQNAFNILNKDKLLDNDYYQTCIKWVDDLLTLTIYLLLIILKLYQLNGIDLKDTELFDTIGSLFTRNKDSINLCDTEKEIASVCGEDFFTGEVQTMLKTDTSFLGKEYTYNNTDNNKDYNQNADITLKGYKISEELKSKILEQIKDYIIVSQIQINYDNYKKFKNSSQNLLDIYIDTLTKIPQNIQKSPISQDAFSKNSPDIYKSTLTSITELYDNFLLLSSVSTSQKIKSIILKVIKSMEIIFNSNDDIYKDFKNSVIIFLSARKLDQIKNSFEGFIKFYQMYKTKDSNSNFNNFITKLNTDLKSKNVDEINDSDLSNISQYTKWLGNTANKIIGGSLKVGLTASSISDRLSKLNENVPSYNPSIISINKKKDTVKIPINDPNNYAGNSEFTLTYENSNLDQKDNITINISVFKLDKNSNYEVLYLGPDYDNKKTTIPVSYSDDKLEDIYLNKIGQKKVYSLEPSQYNLPVFWYGKNITGTSISFDEGKIDEISKSKKTFKTKTLYNFIVDNGLDYTKPIIQIDISNPNNLDKFDFSMDLDIEDYDGIIIKIDNDGKFNILNTSELQLYYKNLSLTNSTGTYFITSYKTNSICLTSSANILTPKGYKNIKELKAGDNVITSNNKIVKIEKVTKMTLIPPSNNLPYLIPAGSLGINYPPKNVILSGKHAILMPNKTEWFIPNNCSYLNNKIVKINQKTPITYYHIILPNYYEDNLVINNGCIVESCGIKNRNGLYIKNSNGLFLRKKISSQLVRLKKNN